MGRTGGKGKYGRRARGDDARRQNRIQGPLVQRLENRYPGICPICAGGAMT